MTAAFPFATQALRTGLAAALALPICGTALALTGIQIGPSGKTWASADLQCALHPSRGMAPMLKAGLYNPKKSAKGTVLLNGSVVATVNFASPDATLWPGNGIETVSVMLGRTAGDSFGFDATPDFDGQPNVCIPDTRGNTVSGGLEYAPSGKSYATVVPGCAFNARTGAAQPYVNLFDNGSWLLNVSVNNQPLTQLGISRPHTPVFLSPGLNVITAAYGALSTDAYVRDGGSGSCVLP